MKKKPKSAAPPPAAPQPVFAQPAPSPDPAGFKVPHPSDNLLYTKVNPTLLQPVPGPRGPGAPIMELASALGSAGPAAVAAIQRAGQVVFHMGGDTGSVSGPATQSLVADKMVADFADPLPANRPAFLFHLGDVVYSFGEGKYYYDQFYEPYREYPAPIFAIPGNHDGVVYTGDPAPTLQAFLANFCAAAPVVTPEAGGLDRTAMTEPGPYFTLEAPFVRIIGLYSNVLEDPGVISSQGDASSPLDDRQTTFLTAELARAKADAFPGAVLVAVHHPPYTYGSTHSGSPLMLADLDASAAAAGFWPHAVLSGHSHNYQRFTRTVGATQVPYIVCGNAGHGLDGIQQINHQPIRTPTQSSPTLVFESYDDQDYGYLRVVATAGQLRIEYHPAADGTAAKTPDDVVTVDLATRRLAAS
jgi:hypothetical protein